MSWQLEKKAAARPPVAIGSDPEGLLLAAEFRAPRHPWVDLDDVTRLFVEDGRISSIGKRRHPDNVFDTGVIHCTPALFEAIRESDRPGDASLSGGVRAVAGRGRARGMDIGSRLDLFVCVMLTETAIVNVVRFVYFVRLGARLRSSDS